VFTVEQSVSRRFSDVQTQWDVSLKNNGG